MRKILLKISLFGLALVLVGAGCVSFGGNKKGPQITGESGMFVSVDKGESWSSISLQPTATGVKNISEVSVYGLFPDPQDPGALYWASRENGFFYTYDEGRTWQQPAGDLQKGHVYSIAVHPDNKCTIYVTNGSRIFKTEDCNRTWEEMYKESRPNVRVNSITINPLSPYQVFVAGSNGDLLESLDYGKSWHIVKRFTKQELMGVYADPLQKDVFYIATKKHGMYRSKDSGKTWESLSESMKDFTKANEFRRFLVHGEQLGYLYWVSTYGILMSKDGGDTWESVDLIPSPGVTQIYGFYVNPKNTDEMYYTATIDNVSTFYKTVDGGENWMTRNMPSGQLPTVLYVHPEKEEIIYMGFTKIQAKK
jgi:photosystem II stability/assembly factor-like uncharacterized protein